MLKRCGRRGLPVDTVLYNELLVWLKYYETLSKHGLDDTRLLDDIRRARADVERYVRERSDKLRCCNAVSVSVLLSELPRAPDRDDIRRLFEACVDLNRTESGTGSDVEGFVGLRERDMARIRRSLESGRRNMLVYTPLKIFGLAARGVDPDATVSMNRLIYYCKMAIAMSDAWTHLRNESLARINGLRLTVLERVRSGQRFPQRYAAFSLAVNVTSDNVEDLLGRLDDDECILRKAFRSHDSRDSDGSGLEDRDNTDDLEYDPHVGVLVGRSAGQDLADHGLSDLLERMQLTPVEPHVVENIADTQLVPIVGVPDDVIGMTAAAYPLPPASPGSSVSSKDSPAKPSVKGTNADGYHFTEPETSKTANVTAKFFAQLVPPNSGGFAPSPVLGAGDSGTSVDSRARPTGKRGAMGHGRRARFRPVSTSRPRRIIDVPEPQSEETVEARVTALGKRAPPVLPVPLSVTEVVASPIPGSQERTKSAVSSTPAVLQDAYYADIASKASKMSGWKSPDSTKDSKIFDAAHYSTPTPVLPPVVPVSLANVPKTPLSSPKSESSLDSPNVPSKRRVDAQVDVGTTSDNKTVDAPSRFSFNPPKIPSEAIGVSPFVTVDRPAPALDSSLGNVNVPVNVSDKREPVLTRSSSVDKIVDQIKRLDTRDHDSS